MRREEAEILHVDDVTVDVGARKVLRGGRDVPMGRLSFEFLLALARAAPSAVTADELVETVWGQAAVTDETLQQRASLVRQALGDLGTEKRYIETVRGHGYRLIPAVSRKLREDEETPAPIGVARSPFATLLKILVVLVLLLVITWVAVLIRGAKRDASNRRDSPEPVSNRAAFVLVVPGPRIVPAGAARHSQDRAGLEARRALEARGLEANGAALIAAIDAEDLAIVELLLQAGVSADTRNEASRLAEPALVRAVARNNPALVDALIAGGADLDAATRDTLNTPLLVAAERHAPELLERFIAAGANANAADKYGATALMWASVRPGLRMLRALLESGVVIDQPARNGMTALHWAARQNRAPHAEALLDAGASVDARDQHGRSAFALAVMDQRWRAFEVLKAHGAPIDSGDADGWTPLMAAARDGNAGMASRLLESGANPDSVGRLGWFPLAIAVTHGHENLAELLLRAGADPDSHTHTAGTALTIAARDGQLEAATLLLDSGADLELAADDFTPLAWSVAARDEALVRLLLGAGARADAPTRSGESIVDLARRLAGSEIAELLRGGPDE